MIFTVWESKNTFAHLHRSLDGSVSIKLTGPSGGNVDPTWSPRSRVIPSTPTMFIKPHPTPISHNVTPLYNEVKPMRRARVFQI